MQKINLLNKEITVPVKWFKNIKRKNSRRRIFWTINKEKIYENYPRQYYVTHIFDQKEDVYEEIHKPVFKKGIKIKEPKRYHSKKVVLPDGNIITPVRQFCETVVLPIDKTHAYFFSMPPIILEDVMENEPISSEKVGINKKEVDFQKGKRGAKINIGYTQLQETVTELVSAMNRSFSLESIKDENYEVLNRCMNESNSMKWVNYIGARIVSDEHLVNTNGNLTLSAISIAKGMIEDEGLDSSLVVLATSGKAIRDLIFSPELDSYVKRYNKEHPDNKLERPAVITHALIEKLLGIKMFKTSAVTYKDGITRSVMFLPHVSFGLVVGDTIQFEGQKNGRKKIASVTGLARTKAIIKIPETVVRISHA